MEFLKTEIPLSGAKWAAKSEAYAAMISEHLTPSTVWLDAGCGRHLLEDDMEPLEDWLVDHCRRVVGLDASVTTHRNINLLVRGTLYALPFADNSMDLGTMQHGGGASRQTRSSVRRGCPLPAPRRGNCRHNPEPAELRNHGQRYCVQGDARRVATSPCP